MFESMFLNVSVIYQGHGDVFRSFTWGNDGVGRINGSEERDFDCDVELISDAGVIKVKAKYPQIQWAQPGDCLKCKLEITPMGKVFLNSAISDVDRNVLNNIIKENKNERV